MRMTRCAWLLLAYLVFMIGVTIGGSEVAWAAKVYRWVDAQGKVSFSDQPPEASAAKYSEPPQLIDVGEPPLQEPSADNQRRLEENRRWFQQRAKERQAQEAKRAKEQARQARADQQWRDRCDKARLKLAAAERKYDVQRRTWLKPAAKSRLKERVELQRAEVKRHCNS